ncbi:MAG: PAS domain-containing sensor histidine kinase [Bacteroidota bacterium]|nr:PAS domain-containing sensor histidine kinase [Bacteroidota bacterium]
MENHSIDFKAVFKFMPGNSILVQPNPPYTILAVTEGMINRSGISEDKLVNKSFFEPFPANPSNPDDPNSPAQNIVLSSFEYVIAQKQSHNLPVLRYDLANADGTFSELYWKIYHKPVFNNEGTLLYILHTSEDITDKVKAERREVITKGIEKMHDMFMETPIAIGIFKGEDLTIELANSAMREIWKKNEDVLGKPLAEVIPEFEKEGVIELMNNVRKTGKADHIHKLPLNMLRNGNNETVYINSIFQPYYETNKDEAIGVIAIGNNVTDKLLAKKEADELRERFETMANNIPNLAWIANADGYIFWYNNRWYEYTGTTPQQMEGWGWQSVHDPEQLPAVLKKWKNSINTGQPFEMVFPLLGADKKLRPFLTRIIPIKDEDGKVLKWLGTNTDIEKQKEVERMKDDFLSIASHELKTPVTTIKAYAHIAESLVEKSGDMKTAGIMKNMNTQVNRLTHLIENLLDVSKIETGKLIYDENFYDVKELVINVVGDMQKISTTHNIIINELAEAKIYGDKNKIYQVVSNLISNAIKYSPNADKIIILVRANQNGVHISIQDFGIGISHENQLHVFEQFYRVNGANESTYPGMGIGLYISSEIIKRQGGKILIDSILDKGSTFTISLPFDHRKNSN